MSPEIVNNIANTVYYLFENTVDEDMLEVLPDILNLFDFKYQDSILYYQDTPIPKITKYSNRITPLDLKRDDIDKVEAVLNKPNYVNCVSKTAPFFESVGWVLSNDCGIFKIHFEGSNVYEIWNEPMMRWDDEMDDDSCDWWSGDGWIDGYDFEKLDFNWKNSVEESCDDSYIIYEEK